MPAKNRLKIYLPDSYYHIYNRGVEKRNIFLDEQDYAVYLSYLKTYLLPKDIQNLQNILFDSKATRQEKDKATKLLRLNNFSESLSLLAYCLMPNHFHFLVHQSEETAIDMFMNSLSTRYSMYFNQKYKRVGSLYQGVYKAVSVGTTEQLLYISKYIHRNPVAQGQALRNYAYSSYMTYVGKKACIWVKSGDVINEFPNIEAYQTFVESEDDCARPGLAQLNH